MYQKHINNLKNNMANRVVIVMGFLALLLRRFKGWTRIFQILVSSFINIFSNPSFIMFSLIAVGLGTMGIWIPFSPFDFEIPSDEVGFIGHLDNLSVFTFCVATLGNMATEYFFEEKGNNSPDRVEISNDEEYEKILSKHTAFFGWSLAFLLSFLSLASDRYLLPGLGTTLVLWMFININRPKFRAINRAAMNDLKVDLKRDGSRIDDDFGGPGL